MANTKITKKATRQLVYKKIEGALAKIKGEVKEKKFDKKLHKASNILAKDIVKAAKKDPPKKAAAKKAKAAKKDPPKKAAAKKVKAQKKDVVKKTALKKNKTEKPFAKKVKAKKAAKKAKKSQPKQGNALAVSNVDQISETVTP